jgi:membrane fusion protein (multidrug efflux system)
MRSGRTALAILLIAAASGAAGFYYRSLLQQADPAVEAQAPEAEEAPVAAVQVTPLRVESIEETLTALGTVEAAPGETQTLSVPFESRVSRVLVVSGQSVEVDEPLVEVEPSPDTRLALDQARQERDAARNQLDVVQQRQEMKLSTRQEVLQAEQALQAAGLRVASLERRGIDGRRALAAAGPGIVSRIEVQPGQIVAAGAPLIETIGENQITVRLGVESADAGRLSPGLSVRIQPVNDPAAAFEGRVRRVAREVSAETRLVGVFVTPMPEAHLLLNQYVRGVIAVSSAKGLVAPPAAVLPEGDIDVLYTVEGGRAVRHQVTVGLRSAEQVELVGSDLQAGQMAVVVGNGELQDGMAVEVERAR